VTNSLLSSLMDANLAAAVAILAVLAVRRRARALVGPSIAYALWLVVPAAMLAILAPPRIVAVAAPASFASIPVSATPAFPASLAQLTALAVPVTSRAPDMSHVLLGLWLVGSAVSLALLVLGQRRALKPFGAITPDADDPRLAHAANAHVGPAVVGVFRPRLVVPADFETRFDAAERALILAHERTHLASGHAPINALTALVQALNWFNPLIHLAARCARVDQELACDAAVVSRYPAERRTYAQTLLKTQLADAPLPLGCAWPAKSPTLLAERIEMLAHNSPGRLRLAAGAAVVAILTVGAGVAAWSAEPPVRESVKPAGSQQARSLMPAIVQIAAAPALLPPGSSSGGVDVEPEPTADATQLQAPASAGVALAQAGESTPPRLAPFDPAQPADPQLKPATVPVSSLPQPAPAAPIDVTADEGKVVDGEHLSIWRGDASVTMGGDRLMSDELSVYAAGPVQKLVANGHVLYVSAHGIARADHAVYEASPHTLTLTGAVVAVQGKTEYRGEKLVMDLTK